MDVSLVLTHDCNLGCAYCYTGAKFRKRMPRAIADKALDLAFGDDAPEIQLSYFGGEPTLELPLLLEIATAARERAAREGKKLVQTVTTNGTLLDREAIEDLYAREIYLALSIDGTQAAHDANRPTMGGGSSFPAVERALRLLVEAGRPFETISVVTPASARLLGESVAWLFEVGVPRVSLNPCYETAWTDEDLGAWEEGLESAATTVAGWMRRGRTVSLSLFDNKILAALKGGLGEEDKCKLGDGFVAVSPEGHLYPCERLVAEDDRPEHRVGHVDDGVATARVCGLRPDIAEDKHAVNAECDDCVERSRCSASCGCANMAETGDLQVAGGVQCWHERTVARIADAMAEALFAEADPVFLRWYYGRMGVDPEALGARIREGAIRLPARSTDPAMVVPRTRLRADGRRALPVVG
jgi:uncharacterized protein